MWFDPGLAGLFITSTLLHLGEDINLLVVSVKLSRLVARRWCLLLLLAAVVGLVAECCCRREPAEERGRSVCRGGRSVWLRATNGKMTEAKMGVGSSLRR